MTVDHEYVPATDHEVALLLREASGTVRVQGCNTKPAFNADCCADSQVLSTRALEGITEYAPTEFTVTVRAGTRLSQLVDTLAQEGQYLPFDPPGALRGATIGGTIASGLSGPSRLRHGGARDFVIGVRFVDGLGNLVTGGGKVVKNAAGFDFPKMMVGSRGRLGVLVEVTLKVFPQPEAYRTIVIQCESFEGAVKCMNSLVNRGFDLAAMELMTEGELWVRLCGPEAATERDADQVVTILTAAQRVTTVETGEAEQRRWSDAREATWVPEGHALIKVPLSSTKLLELEEPLRNSPALRRYSAAGNVAWLAWPRESSFDELERLLLSTKLAGLVTHLPPDETMHPQRVRYGIDTAQHFANRIRSAIDPQDRFKRITM